MKKYLDTRVSIYLIHPLFLFLKLRLVMQMFQVKLNLNIHENSVKTQPPRMIREFLNPEDRMMPGVHKKKFLAALAR